MTSKANVSTLTIVPSPPRTIVGMDEIRALLVDVSMEGVQEITFRNDFPEPAAELAAGDVWFLEDVEAWINEHGDVAADVFKRAR